MTSSQGADYRKVEMGYIQFLKRRVLWKWTLKLDLEVKWK